MKIDIVRFWKDAAFRQSLSAQEQAQLPENPVGAIELTEADLISVIGAAGGDPTDIRNGWTCQFDCTEDPTDVSCDDICWV